MTLENLEEMYHVELTVKASQPPHRRVELECNLSLQDLEQRFLAPYGSARPIVTRGRTIAVDDLHRLRVYKSERQIDDITNVPQGVMVDVTPDFITLPAGYKMNENNTAEGSLAYLRL